MKYITGIIALGTECELPTCGLWNISKQQYLDDELCKLMESEESPFKNWGIEVNKVIRYREFCLFNVANHTRAYVDMLYKHEFEQLKDIFFEAINNGEARKDIFMLVYGKLRHLAGYNKINEFMDSEFGNAWVAYKSSVESVAEHLANRQDAIDRLEEIQSQAKEMKINII